MDKETKLTDKVKNYTKDFTRKSSSYLFKIIMNFLKQFAIWTGILLGAIIFLYILLVTPAFKGFMDAIKNHIGLSGQNSATAAGAAATMLIIAAFVIFILFNFIFKRLKKEFKDYKTPQSNINEYMLDGDIKPPEYGKVKGEKNDK